MSIVAEFANTLHAAFPPKGEIPIPATGIKGKSARLLDVQAVIFDVYGTLINYWNNQFKSDAEREKHILSVFRKTADYFGFTEILEKVDATKAPEQTLSDFYHGLISMKHEEGRKQGRTFPEIRIEEIWDVILSILVNNGFDLASIQQGERRDTAMSIAYYYNFFALNRGFFDAVVPALKALKEQNIKLGIISNAQFYTPIDLTLFLRDQNSELVDYLELFSQGLCFFSFEYGVAKPNPLFYERLFNALYEHEILPEQCVFIGNDLALDIKAAQEVGLKTALFTGNKGSTFLHDMEKEVTPDMVFSDFKELPNRISFWSDANQ